MFGLPSALIVVMVCG